MKTAFVFLITGFEEIEALATVDILRRGGVDVKTISLTSEKTVEASHKVSVIADLLFDEIKDAKADILILPGGTPDYDKHQGVKDLILAYYNNGKNVAAICASPMVLGGLGILKGKKATCYPGFEKYLDGAILQTHEAVIVDGNVITGHGPGLTIEFALQLLEILEGKSKRDEVAKALLLK